MKKLVVTEKPSVARSIAEILGANNRGDGYLEGDDYIVSWCVGHLVELAEPQAYDEKYEKWRKSDLPIIPLKGNSDWKYQVTEATKKQYKILKGLMEREDVSSLVEATDAGREGELIFRLVYNQARCKKPFERLWISSMEDEAIRDGFANLKPGSEYDALYEAALCRERADWIVGINATRLFSSLYGQTLNVGRVMTPTLALAVEREASISAFKPEDFYTVLLDCGVVTLSSERFKDKTEAMNLKAKCEAEGKAVITKAEKKEKQEKAPTLFDLTSLQREANKRLGYTAQQTLDYTQSLYEKKLCSYPRTDSKFLTDDMAQTVTTLLGKIAETYDISAIEQINIQKVIDGKKVTDHHAIIPTVQIAVQNLTELPKGEQEILKLISTRVAEAVSAPCKYEEMIIEAECAGGVFKAKGKRILEGGWKLVSKLQSDDEEGSDDNGAITIDLTSGQNVDIENTNCKEGKTTPPKSFTEDTLLSAMEKAGADETPDEAERKGLGTPATRAGIIEKLVRVGFVERKGDKKTKYLVPTHKGIALITVIPEEIQSPSMTAEWEQKLLQIEKGGVNPDDFMEEISQMITELVNTYEMVKDAETVMKPGYEPVGTCPCCGASVIEKSKGFFCESNDCKFALWKENRFFDSLSKKLNKQIAVDLLSKGKTKLKKCRSAKTGKTYNCTVTMTVNDVGAPQFGLEFEKNRGNER
ncbi:MAG: DNA topoisomerase 3 [Lachnospiraceae bacterium]|nr:DNA topoisomerase 3 [Lachnospiraceae bacterium]